jgi:hypothetical protein
MSDAVVTGHYAGGVQHGWRTGLRLCRRVRGQPRQFVFRAGRLRSPHGVNPAELLMISSGIRGKPAARRAADPKVAKCLRRAG